MFLDAIVNLLFLLNFNFSLTLHQYAPLNKVFQPISNGQPLELLTQRLMS